mgnify:CR=1 FL=1
MFSGHWPWWFGGPVFAVVVVAFWLIERRLFGVVGQYVQVLEPAQGAAELDKASPEALEEALRRATLAEFGAEAVAEMEAEQAREKERAPEPRRREPVPRAASLLFLAMLPVGGAIGALVTGQFALRGTLGAVHERVVASGPMELVVLAVGGVLVGVGTRMAGGCTSGHGLSGCSRLQPSSLIATASFFGTGIAVSFLLHALVKP